MLFEMQIDFGSKREKEEERKRCFTASQSRMCTKVKVYVEFRSLFEYTEAWLAFERGRLLVSLKFAIITLSRVYLNENGVLGARIDLRVMPSLSSTLFPCSIFEMNIQGNTSTFESIESHRVTCMP